MLTSMTDEASGYTKITVSLPTADLSAAKALVADGGAKSVSGLLADALRMKLSKQRDLALLDAMTGGQPLPHDALTWAARVLGVPEIAERILEDNHGRIAS